MNMDDNYDEIAEEFIEGYELEGGREVSEQDFIAALERQVQSCLRVGIEQQDEIRFLKNKVRLLENQIEEYKDLEV